MAKSTGLLGPPAVVPVTVKAAEALFVQRTVVPFFTVTVAGAKAVPEILTACTELELELMDDMELVELKELAELRLEADDSELAELREELMELTELCEDWLLCEETEDSDDAEESEEADMDDPALLRLLMELWELMEELEVFPPKRNARTQVLTALPLMNRKLPPHGRGIFTEFCVMQALIPVLMFGPVCAEATVAIERGATTAARRSRTEAVLTALRCDRESADIKNKGRNNMLHDEWGRRVLRDF